MISHQLLPRAAPQPRQCHVPKRMKAHRWKTGRTSQSRVPRIKRGDLEKTELATLRAFVRALGGDIEVTVKLDEDRFLMSRSQESCTLANQTGGYSPPASRAARRSRSAAFS